MPLTLGRWRIDRYENAIWLQRQPDPNCLDCNGAGRTDDEAQEIETSQPRIEICDCWNPWGGIRIPIHFRLRSPITERYPF
ncbi:hypothetical protein ACIPW5_11175 [Streptomyces sp. NPDC090077]|uniref:hypothetical protein n=1 Tax=Streptomyces sp. NPDC090077 TaxID=3365938 RepID=UPI003812FE29